MGALVKGPSRVAWARFSDTGYEVSSAGDRRFSPLFAEMPDGRTIEMHYQCDVKGFNPGGRNWREYKGRGSRSRQELFVGFVALWAAWATVNPALIDELDALADRHNNLLTDQFARTQVNQARALACVLNHKRLNEWSLL